MSRAPVCLMCGVRVDHHPRITPAVVELSRGAPVTVYGPTGPYTIRAPLSPSIVGQYLGHDPLPPRGTPRPPHRLD